MVEEFRIQCQVGGNGYASKPEMLAVISRVAQQLSSIPDKARLGAMSVLSSQYPCGTYILDPLSIFCSFKA